MPTYSYQAVDAGGNVTNGKIEARDEAAIVNRLKQMKLTVLDISEAKTSAVKTAFQAKATVSMGELGLFTRQLGAMLNAGVPLIRTLHALSEQSSNATLASVIGDIAKSVEGGTSFSEAMNSYPEVFHSMYRDMVKAGELGGNLVEVLGRLSEQIERDKELRDNIKTATFYPLTVMTFAAVVLVAMLFFVVPVFSGMFPDGVVLPLPTRVIVGLSDAMRAWWYLFAAAIVTFALAIKFYISTESGQLMWDRVKFKLPVFGALFLKTTIARFARTLGTLLDGGIPVVQALETAGPTSGSVQVAGVVKEAGRRVQDGESLVEPLRESSLFPPVVTIMMAVGVETGELPAFLNRIAEFYESEVASMTKGLASLIEPILIIFVGGSVGMMVVALYLPMFTVITQIG